MLIRWFQPRVPPLPAMLTEHISGGSRSSGSSGSKQHVRDKDEVSVAESDCNFLALNAEDTLKAGPAQDESEEADAHGLTPGAWIQARMCWRRSPRPGMPTSRHVLGKQAPSPLLSLTWGHLRDMSTYHRLSGLLQCMCAPRPLPPGGIDHGSFLKPSSFLWHLCHWVVRCSLWWSKRDTSGLQM